MNVYRFTFTIPANTPASSPAVAIWRIPAGSIRYFRIYIPPGHFGLAHMAIWHGGLQIAPLPEGEWFNGNDGWIDFEPTLEVRGGEITLVLSGYNEDEAYQHSFHIYAYTEPAPTKPVSPYLAFMPAREVPIA
jgi:hypothetical protein